MQKLLVYHWKRLNDAMDSPGFSQEAEHLANELEFLWEKLPAAHKASLAGLGSDLNWVRRGRPIKAPTTSYSLEKHVQLKQAAVESSWHEVLSLARDLSFAEAPKEVLVEIFELRSKAWLALGYPNLAHIFYGYSCRLDPHCQNGSSYCLVGRGGIICPDDSCDIDDGLRKDPRYSGTRQGYRHQ